MKAGAVQLVVALGVAVDEGHFDLLMVNQG